MKGNMLLHLMLAFISALVLAPTSALGASSREQSTTPPASDVGILTVSIPSSPNLPHPQNLSPSTHAVLTTAQRAPLVARLDRRNRCIFPAVPIGSYLLEIWSGEYSFEKIRVDVTRPVSTGGETDGGRFCLLVIECHTLGSNRLKTVRIEAWQTFIGNAWSNRGERLGAGSGSLEISGRAIGAKQYFEQRQGFNVVGLLSSPMILIGIAGMAMMIGVPKMLENSKLLWDCGIMRSDQPLAVDPETRAEFEETQRQNPLASGLSGGANPLGNFDMAAWMAGSSSKNQGQPVEVAGGTSGAETGSGKARKRA